MQRERSASAPPVFVGGTGRSGTTILARLIGWHSRYARLPMELRVHCKGGGLTDLVEGRTTAATFIQRMEDDWFYYDVGDGRPKGLHWIIGRWTLSQAVERFQCRFDEDQRAAARELIHALCDPIAVGVGKSGWIEATPATTERAAELSGILPAARFVHTVRDGRDVACSVARQPWGPADPVEGLRWWAARLRASARGIAQLSSERALTVSFDELVAGDREGTYARLLAFLDLPDEPGIRRYFDERLGPEPAHRGRWRADVAAEDAPDFERLHRSLCEELSAEGHLDGQPLKAEGENSSATWRPLLCGDSKHVAATPRMRSQIATNPTPICGEPQTRGGHPTQAFADRHTSENRHDQSVAAQATDPGVNGP